MTIRTPSPTIASAGGTSTATFAGVDARNEWERRSPGKIDQTQAPPPPERCNRRRLQSASFSAASACRSCAQSSQAFRLRPAGVSSIVSIMANDMFKALAHPLRREIVERLSGGVATVGEVTRDFGVSKPTVSRHLKLLEEAGVVSRVIDGRTHRLALRPEALGEASDWIERQRVRWERVFDVVGEYLEERKSNDD